MMNRSPFLIFPWQRPFLPDLKAVLEDCSGGRSGSALLIVPHNRPWRYLLQLYAKERKPRLLPKVLTLADMVKVCGLAPATCPCIRPTCWTAWLCCTAACRT